MSYRTFANGEQIFGNGEYYPEWIEFIKSQGIEVDEEGLYEGDITDFMGALVTIENIVMRLNQEKEKRIEECGGLIGNRKISHLFDFTNIPFRVEEGKKDPDEHWGPSLLDELFDVVENTYAFMPYCFYMACEKMLVKDHVFTTPKHFHCFKLKDGEKIHVRAS